MRAKSVGPRKSSQLKYFGPAKSSNLKYFTSPNKIKGLVMNYNFEGEILQAKEREAKKNTYNNLYIRRLKKRMTKKIKLKKKK